MPQFFLDSDKGSLAFLKEADQPDWSSTAYWTVQAADMPVSLPADDSSSKVLDTSSLRKAVIILSPNSGATYEFSIHAWMESNNIEGFYPLEDGKYTVGYTENLLVGVRCQNLDDITVLVDKLDTGSLDIEIAPIPFEP